MTTTEPPEDGPSVSRETETELTTEEGTAVSHAEQTEIEKEGPPPNDEVDADAMEEPETTPDEGLEE